MGIVTNYLFNLIIKQVDDHKLVVWFDPDGCYRNAARELSISATKIAYYDGSFFALRSEIEPLLSGFEPPRLVVYVPMDPAEAHNALIEVEAAGVVIKPGQQPPARNTRLSLIGRNALKPILGEDAALSIEKQVEAGKLTLADLDQLAERGEGITRGVVSIIFSTSNPQDVALEFLSSSKHDDEIVNKRAAAELAELLQSGFGIEQATNETLEDLRKRFARYVLATDLKVSLQGKLPDKLTSVKAATKPPLPEACAGLAKTWRLRRDLKESYISHADRIEKELGLHAIDFGQEQIANVETFLEIEIALQRKVEISLLKEATAELVDLAKARQSSFWSEQIPDVQAQWALVAVSGQVLLEADRIEKELKSAGGGAKALFKIYTESDRPWCLLDTSHRNMERLCHNFKFDLGDRHKELEQLITRARQRYMEIGAEMSASFIRQYQEERFQIADLLRQTEIFEKRVKPKLLEGETAYVWVDALRYEMARELALSISTEFDVKIESAIGTIPAITEIGMAALLPGAHEPVSVVPVGESKLGLEIKGNIIKDRKDRVKFLKANAGQEVFDAKLEDFFPTPSKKIREAIRNGALLLITSQEIDEVGEGDNIHLARSYIDEVLYQLRRVFRMLAELGVNNIILVSDHGYLFGDELTSADKIDPPGGERADLHRRVWVGRGGAADKSYLRARLADFGIGGDLEVAVPWSFACFKVKGGARAYFHGGLSLQEIVIPVVTLTSKKKPIPISARDIVWSLSPGSKKISTRFFSVQIKGSATGLFELSPLKVRVEIRADGECISVPISASYGFEEATGDVQLKQVDDDPKEFEPNTITLMIKDSPQKVVTLFLFDAASGAELARLDKVEMALAF